jgi:hypothetical protein
MPITPAVAIADPALLGPAFAGVSWDRWRAILRAAYAEPLTDPELAAFREVANRDPPARQVRELWVIAGRRSGKDSIASAIAAVAALGDHREHLRPGERATVMCLAVDREQARIVSRYTAAYFREVPLLQPLVARETDDGLELTNSVEIVIATNSYRAVRGRTILAVILDEVSFWRSEDAAYPDQETYAAVLPGLVTLPGAMLIGITTAYRRAGLAYQKWQAHFGKNDDDVLVVYGPSTAFNPSLPQAIIDAALARDPEAASAEWLSVWRSDLSDFLDRELIEAAVDAGVVARPPQPGLRYTAFTDPSGGRGDAFTCAVSHADGTTATLDCLYERRAPFDPSTVVAEIADLLRGYGVTEVTGDRYAAQWVVEAFSKVGVVYRQSDRDRSAIYLDALPLFTAGRARLLDHPRLIHQLTSLERRTSRTGRDRVDHPLGGADDLANAAAGAFVLAASAAAPSLWRRDALAPDGHPAPWPRLVDLVFASVAADERGIAILYWAADQNFGGPLLTLVDYHQQPFTPDLFVTIRDRLRTEARAARAHACIFTSAAMAAQMRAAFQEQALTFFAAGDIAAARAAELPVEGGADALLADREALMLAAAVQIGAGKVRLAAPAQERSHHMPLPLLDLRPGAPASAASDAALIGVGATVNLRALPRAAA